MVGQYSGKALSDRKGKNGITLAGKSGWSVVPSQIDERTLLEQLDAFRGRLPADFRFDRAEASGYLKGEGEDEIV